MPTRFDHAVIAVRDLDSAIQRFQHLGFDAQPGGRHTGRGTHNGLVRFGLDYFELLSVYDEAEARDAGRGNTILDALQGKEAALVGYALATTTLDHDAELFRGTEKELPLPHATQRKRPDGSQLSWRTLAPGGKSWGRAWPFLIQWDAPDEERLQLDVPGTHANGATGWIHVDVAVHDLESAVDVYQNQLGLELLKQDTCPRRVAKRATFGIGKSTIALLAPDGEGLVQQVLAEKGEGPYALRFSVVSVEHTRSFLESREIKFTYESTGSGTITLDPDEALGVRLSFVG
jgi:catechol 2,3-dioxygenase-like lactoylglutathione lyase family enzyme